MIINLEFVINRFHELIYVVNVLVINQIFMAVNSFETFECRKQYYVVAQFCQSLHFAAVVT